MKLLVCQSAVLLVLIALIPGGVAQRPSRCDQSSCYPEQGNLLIGREDRLSATSTCGLRKRERYCIVSHLEEAKKCFWCDSSPPFADNPALSHTVDNLVHLFKPDTRRRSWWQSENGVEKVSVQLDLEAEFHITHLIIKFKTFRPAAMLIERSFDFGKTWQVYRYFADNCDEVFPGISHGPPRNMLEIVCESRYSNVAPSTEGEVIFRVLPPHIHIDDPYAEEVLNLLKVTNLRVNFTKLHTLGDDLLDQRDEILEKYYYAIYKMIVRGTCSCYGHASRCIPFDSSIKDAAQMVHGRCECTHNTKGPHCKECEDFYNDLPWKPAIGRQSNACKRCNCNNHATKCHFDKNVYESTGRVSGGVCDECQHNTMGRNCEQCKPFYYQDPGRDITDPSVCLPCDCDARGSLDGAICDPRNDPLNGFVAGRCHCKQNVEGRQCDRCKRNFYNFTEANHLGCQPCTCNPIGTTGAQGCNPYSGECECKRFVTGRDCNQCAPQHWGLSQDDPNGCKPCNCDPGGSYDNNCDVITGQCRCRRHVTGQRCDRPEQGYFAGVLDHHVYEAELARGSERICTSEEDCQVVIREPYHDGRETTWTGTGFMRVYEGSHLEFDINDIQNSLDYDLVLRYEPQMAGDWDDVQIKVIRPGPVDPNGSCGRITADDDLKRLALTDDERFKIARSPLCLEAGKPYTIRIDFKQYDRQQPMPSAAILIDSIALVPKIESLPFFQGTSDNEYRRQEFERYRCGQAYYTVTKPPVPDICKKYLYSVGFYTLAQGEECSCDPTGSLSALCNDLGGQCQCKPNVAGRRCDRCAPGTYGFGPEGCSPCECNAIGSLDNFCDPKTGQCQCRINTYGRQCDQCQTGFWNFPNCQRCECHGHAATCDSNTGYCINCKDYTVGPNCDRCIEGWYGDPRFGVDIPCRPCPCPETKDSGHSFADKCYLDPRSNDVICECAVGYGGPRCDVCADNYFGNPDVPGGSCQSCQCNNNIDLSRPRNCDARTGECLQCLFSTEGFNCEMCKAGYYGDAIHQQCAECVCNILGTDTSRGPCDRRSGQCPCFPNVIGQECDRCAANHWKIASGQGCEPCNCDPYGSREEQCNEYDGQCRCKEGFGGRRCDQCLANYWGDPRQQKCFPCNCDPRGSATMQCDRRTGKCECVDGIGGDKCDRCARGFIGSAFNCRPCGECFDNWDRILMELTNRTEAVVQAASEIKQAGATGAYTKEFEAMEDTLDEVAEILANATISNADLEKLKVLIDDLRKNLTEAKVELDEVELEVDDTTQRIYKATLELSNLRSKATDLQKQAQKLENEATLLQEANVEGALNITRDAQARSRASQKKVEDTKQLIRNSQDRRQATKYKLSAAGTQFNVSQQQNQQALDAINRRLEEIDDQIPTLNSQVCGKYGDPCDDLCGGAGCGKCGGLSCKEGSVNKAATALSLARDAEDLLKKKQTEAESQLRVVSQAKVSADQAQALSQNAFNLASAAFRESNRTKNDMQELIREIEAFLATPGASPAEIRTLADEVLSMSISLRPEQIKELAMKINETVASLTNIDAILQATASDLALAKDLKARADRAKAQAVEVLTIAQEVLKALQEAELAQGQARTAINQASGDVQSAQNYLTQISSETATAQRLANESHSDVTNMEMQLRLIGEKFVVNEREIGEATNAAQEAHRLAKEAERDLVRLKDTYQKAEMELEKKLTDTDEIRERAERLQERARLVFANVMDTVDQLDVMQDKYQKTELELGIMEGDLEELNRRMNGYLKVITDQSEFYRKCQP